MPARAQAVTPWKWMCSAAGSSVLAVMLEDGSDALAVQMQEQFTAAFDSPCCGVGSGRVARRGIWRCSATRRRGCRSVWYDPPHEPETDRPGQQP